MSSRITHLRLSALQARQRVRRSLTGLGWQPWRISTGGYRNAARARQAGVRLALLAALSGAPLMLAPIPIAVHADGPAGVTAPALLPPPIDLTTQASQTLYGADTDDRSGLSVSAGGDVNGDGFDDYLISAYTADGPTNNRSASGDSYLIYGSPTRPAVLDLTTLGSAGITFYGARANDQMGVAVSTAGDVNRDGFDDLLLGAFGGDGPGNTRNSAGNSYLVYGGASLPATLDLASLGSAGVTLYGAEADDLSGRFVSGAGDTNGDGFDDLLIGAYHGDGPGNMRATAGDSYLVYGGASLPATLDLASLASKGVTLYGAQAGDRSGYVVSGTGDVNGDGFDDLLLGAYRADGPGNTRSDAGDSYLIYGGASLPATLDLASLGSAGVTFYGAQAGDRSGYAVSGAGDANGDGFDDLLIGAYRGDGPGNTRGDAGESYLVYGGASLPATLDLGSLGDTGVVLYGAELLDASGFAVSDAGDVNQDGFDDLLLGAYQADGPGNTRDTAGDSYLVYGGASLPATLDLASLGSAGVTLYGAEAGDRSGFSVSGAGDVDNDGFDDLLVGAFLGDGPGNTRESGGDTYLILAEPALGVELASFEAEAVGRDIAVRWETASEVDTLGFHLYRATHPDAEPTRITSAIIPAQAPGGHQGAAYTWTDTSVAANTTYYYWLEDIDTGGTATRHGPVRATTAAPTAIALGTWNATRDPASGWLAGVAGGVLVATIGRLGWHRRR